MQQRVKPAGFLTSHAEEWIKDQVKAACERRGKGTVRIAMVEPFVGRSVCFAVDALLEAGRTGKDARIYAVTTGFPTGHGGPEFKAQASHLHQKLTRYDGADQFVSICGYFDGEPYAGLPTTGEGADKAVAVKPGDLDVLFIEGYRDAETIDQVVDAYLGSLHDQAAIGGFKNVPGRNTDVPVHELNRNEHKAGDVPGGFWTFAGDQSEPAPEDDGAPEPDQGVPEQDKPDEDLERGIVLDLREAIDAGVGDEQLEEALTEAAELLRPDNWDKLKPAQKRKHTTETKARLRDLADERGE